MMHRSVTVDNHFADPRSHSWLKRRQKAFVPLQCAMRITIKRDIVIVAGDDERMPSDWFLEVEKSSDLEFVALDPKDRGLMR